MTYYYRSVFLRSHNLSCGTLDRSLCPSPTYNVKYRMAHKPKDCLGRFLLSPKGRWTVLVTVISVFSTCLVVVPNFDDIFRPGRLHIWNISRFGCFHPLPRMFRPLSKKPLYISHNFQPNVGTGNLMFIYASMWAIAKKNGLTPTIGHTNLHDAVHLDCPPEYFFNLSDCYNYVLGIGQCCLHDARTQYLSELAPGQNVSLWGNLHSWKYFHPEYESDIRRQFAFKEEITERAHQIIQEFRFIGGDSKQERPTVGIHVRRGDVLTRRWRDFGFAVASREYFRHAMEYLKSKGVMQPIFIVCTNDVEWSKQNLVGLDLHFVENEGPYVDMAVLNKMDHLILSTGTYSFFAGYLSSAKHVIYYKRWPQPDSDFASIMDLSSFWLPHWVAME